MHIIIAIFTLAFFLARFIPFNRFAMLYSILEKNFAS